jgi:hypothetical protein
LFAFRLKGELAIPLPESMLPMKVPIAIGHQAEERKQIAA